MPADGVIAGLACPWEQHKPCCGTDTDGIAYCGTSGRRFAYRRDMHEGKPKVALKLMNGRYDEVPVYTTQMIGESE